MNSEEEPSTITASTLFKQSDHEEDFLERDESESEPDPDNKANVLSSNQSISTDTIHDLKKAGDQVFASNSINFTSEALNFKLDLSSCIKLTHPIL